MARLIKISYAGLTIGLGGDASITLFDKFRVAYGYTEFSIEFEVGVRNATRGTFLTAEAALIAAFRTPDGDLDVELGGTDRHSFTHAGNTGFNARATCLKVPDAMATANGAHYRCHVVVQLPADKSGRAGRQTSSIAVDATPAGKRTVTIEGSYTALAGNSATAQYAAAATTYCDGVITALGGTFNVMTPAGYGYDDQNKVLRFKRVYQEVFYRESASTTDVPALKGTSLVITRSTPSHDSAPGFNARPLEQVTATYFSFVDATVSVDLKTTYETVVRPFLLSEIASVAGGTTIVISESPTYDRTENTIRAVLQCAVDLGGSFLTARLEAQDAIDNGNTLVPVWSGDPYARDLYKTPARHRKTVTRITVAKVSGEGGSAGVDARFKIPDFAGFVELQQFRTEARTHVGVFGDGFDVAQVTHTFVFERANLEASSGGGGDSGGGVATQVRGDTPLGLGS